MRENIVDGYHSPLSLSALTVCTSDSWWSSGTCVLARLGLSVPRTTWTWLSSGTSVEPPSSSARFKTFPFVSSFHLTFSLPSPHYWTAYLHLHQMYPPPPPQKARGRSVWLAVHEGGVSLLCPSSMETRSHYSWPQLAAFGSDGDHLVLVVTSSQNGSHDNTDTEKLLFFMSKAKVSPYFTHKPQNHLFLYT